MSDNYEFAKSTLPQGLSTESPFQNKQWNYVNDINGGVYSSQGTSLVQFDLSSIYNSSSLIDISTAFITIPIVYTSAYATDNAGTLVAPKANYSWASTGLKNGYFQLVHAADMTINGKQVEQFQPFLNSYVSFKLLSTMSQDDYAAYGYSLGMGRQLDNPQSLKYNGSGSMTAAAASVYPTFPSTTSPVGGNGMSNNSPFSLGTSNGGDQDAAGAQFTNAYNSGYFSRLLKCVDVAGQATSIYGNSATANIMSSTNLNTELKSTYQVLNGSYMTWYDTAVIRVCDILDSLKNYPLSKKFDGVLRLTINVGAVATSIKTTDNGMVTSLSTNTFTQTCPLMQSCLKNAAASVPATAIAIVSGLSIARAGSTNLAGGVNLALSGASHPMSACRFYYPSVTLKPEKLIPYIQENRSKKVCFTSILTNQINNVTAGSSFSSLIQSGVSGIRGILICPFLSGSTNGVSTGANYTGVTPFSQLLSPLDTAPATTAPISLTNLQVTIGGVNVKQSTLSPTFENFLEETALYEKLNNSDFGLSSGLISQFYWEQSRWYYIDCTRGNLADQMSPRNIVLSFNNNTLQTIDCLVFTERFEELVVDVDSGIITK